MGTFKNEHNVIVLIGINSDFLYQDRCLTHWKCVACIKVIGIFLSVIMIFGAYRVFVVEDKIDSFNELLKEAESTLIEIKTHEKKAKKYEEKAKVSAETAEKLAHSEVPTLL
jgi:biopolymer transport protein ExbB/TolQ